MEAVLEGLVWSVSRAEVLSVTTFQGEDGKPLGWVQLKYWGGKKGIMVDPEVALRFKALQGKMVVAGGDLEVEVKRGKDGSAYTSVQFGLGRLELVK